MDARTTEASRSVAALGRPDHSDRGRPGGATLASLIAVMNELRDGIDEELTAQVAITFLGIAAQEGIGVRELAEKLGLGESAVSRNAGLLAEYGRRGKKGAEVIEMVPDQHDRRLKHLRLTPKGDRLVRRIGSLIEAA